MEALRGMTSFVTRLEMELRYQPRKRSLMVSSGLVKPLLGLGRRRLGMVGSALGGYVDDDGTVVCWRG